MAEMTTTPDPALLLARKCAAEYWRDSPDDAHVFRSIMSGEWDDMAYTQAALAAIRHLEKGPSDEA